MQHGCLLMLAAVVILIANASWATPIPIPSKPDEVIVETWQRFHPVIAKHGMVSVQDTLAAKVGRDILAEGGNAVDAAVGIGFALAVTLPRAGNLGGGGFMLVWLAKQHHAIAIDYRETAPQAATPEYFINPNGEINRKRLFDSYSASGVPGTVKGLYTAQRQFGKLPFKKVIAPAIKLASNGFIVSANLASVLHDEKDRIERSPAARKVFFKKEGGLHQMGDRIVQKDLAGTLRLIQQHGEKAFYQGKIAKQIVADMKKYDGLITENDLNHYQVNLYTPLVTYYRGYEILTMPPPSSGGVSIIELLNILRPFPMKTMGHNTAASIHLLSESMNLVYRDRNHYLGDPAFVKMPVKALISEKHAAYLRHMINMGHHTSAKNISKKPLRDYESDQTTHFSVIDEDGNMVANTYTLNFSFGNAKMVTKAGFFLNNELDDFTIIPGKPNAFGLVQGKSNLLAPGKRPLSSMSPTLVLDKNHHAVLATGSPGGSRIITTVLQVLLNVMDYDYNLASSVLLPRIHSQLWPDTIFVEQGISDDTLRLLRKMGHTITQTRAMGSAQTVGKHVKKYIGVADTRRPGALAVGY